jgi:hypothetical protein
LQGFFFLSGYSHSQPIVCFHVFRFVNRVGTNSIAVTWKDSKSMVNMFDNCTNKKYYVFILEVIAACKEAMSHLYSKATALRILIGIATRIERVREFRNCIQVTYRVYGGGRCSTFLSKKAFIVVNLDIRIHASALVEVVEVVNDDEFIVHSQKTDSYYVVRPYKVDARSRCECGDCHWLRNCRTASTKLQFGNSLASSLL